MQLNAFLPPLFFSLFLFFWHLHWHLSRRINACLSGSKSHSLSVRPSVCLPVSHFVAAGWFISRHLQQQQHRWQQRKKRPCPRLRRGRETFRADRWNFLTTDLFTFKQFHRPDQSVGEEGEEGWEEVCGIASGNWQAQLPDWTGCIAYSRDSSSLPLPSTPSVLRLPLLLGRDRRLM